MARTISKTTRRQLFRSAIGAAFADGLVKNGRLQAVGVALAVPEDIRSSLPFGAAIVKAVNSPRVKLLYDIYHMQIMEGDLIKTINDYKDVIAHYHTGGVPGRHELDATQEVNWPAVCKAIVDTGFRGYLAHEFVPTRDPLTSLREAVLCDV